MKPKYQIFLSFALFCAVEIQSLGLTPKVDTPIEIALKEGYDISKHPVITDDDAIIDLYRIPGKKGRDTKKKPKGVILMLPGISNSASIFMSRGKNSIAFHLSDGNYEIWIANMRGQSDEALLLNTNVLGPKEWYFTLDDQALNDMPAIITYVRGISGFDKIHVVGFSMGNCVTFQFLSDRPEYNDKVASLTALAPAVYVKKDSSPAKVFNQLPQPWDYITLRMFVQYGTLFGFFPFFALIVRFAGTVSPNSPIIQKITLAVAQFILGKDPDLAKIPMNFILSSLTPLPILAFLQFYQGSQSGKFQKFDYGLKSLNEKAYGQATPPEYDLTNIKVPVFYVTGQTDAFQSPDNSKYTTDQLKTAGSLYYEYMVKQEYANHVGFFTNEKAFEFVTSPVFQFIEAISNGTQASDFKLTVPST